MSSLAIAQVVGVGTLASAFDTTASAEGGPSIVITGLTVVVLVSVHLFAGRLRVLDVVPRSRFLSLSGGASVAYVFVHVLPELEHAARTIEDHIAVLSFIEEHVYLLALLGFVSYYGLERFVRESRNSGQRGTPSTGVFWLHIGSFSIYNGLIGYLLFHREVPGVGSLLLFAIAMALHFFVNDYGLRDHHEDTYRAVGRWVLAGAVLGGAVAGYVTAFDRGVLSALFAFLSGGIVLNVIKEELPPERESRFWAFALGASGYASLLIAL